MKKISQALISVSDKRNLKKILSVLKKFKVKISKKYSLRDASIAHKDLENRILTGPAVIIP